MFFLTTIIHAVFVVIFFLFHRYVEMSIVIVIFLIFLSKIIAPLDVIKKPSFFKIKTPESDTLEQSIYISSGILFYTALVGIALGLANTLGVPVDFRLLQYCIFFLTSVIYAVYLLSYPKNPNVFILFRTHTLIVGVVLGLLILSGLLFNFPPIEPLAVFNLILNVIGLTMVIILDRNAPKNVHIFSVYIFVFSGICLALSIISFFSAGLPLSIFGTLFVIAALYVFFPSAMKKAHLKDNIPSMLWHFSNFILALSWAAFIYLFWNLFWGYMDDRIIVSFSLLLLLGLWIWVYHTDDKNPIFFTGMVAVLATFYGFMTFQIIPPIFWLMTVCLFVFSGGLILVSRFFRSSPEELILAGGSVIFLCGTDIVLIFQENNLFALSTLFFFQSFLWYGAYEIFHRQAYAKNRAL